MFNIRNILSRQECLGKLRLRFFCTPRSRLHLWPLYNPGLFPASNIYRIIRNIFRLGRDIEIISIFLPSREKGSEGLSNREKKSRTRLPGIPWHSQMLNRHHHQLKVYPRTAIRTGDGVWESPAGLVRRRVKPPNLFHVAPSILDYIALRPE